MFWLYRRLYSAVKRSPLEWAMRLWNHEPTDNECSLLMAADAVYVKGKYHNVAIMRGSAEIR